MREREGGGGRGKEREGGEGRRWEREGGGGRGREGVGEGERVGGEMSWHAMKREGSATLLLNFKCLFQ